MEETKVLCFGSLNIDHVYAVDHFVRAGETISSASHQLSPGGKGFNQAIAASRAGCATYFAGKVGADADFMLDILRGDQVDTSLVMRSSLDSGHTIIQVDPSGQNCIIVCGGANHDITPADIDQVLGRFSRSDILLLQNETSNLRYMMEKAAALGLDIYLNPSPVTDDLLQYDFYPLLRGILLNEIEGELLTGKSDPEEILSVLRRRNPRMEVILTLGDKGVLFEGPEGRFACDAFKTSVVDTTAAGDTFTGYFLAGRVQKLPIPAVLRAACAASSIAVSRPGAAQSIPYANEVAQALPTA